MITGRTRLLCIIADPIAHVRTPEIFNEHLAAIGAEAVVMPVHVRSADLRTVVDGLRRMQNLSAIIVTVPHKIAIVDLCDELEPSARLMGAANIVRRTPDGRLVGANFDGAGLAAALEAELGTLAGSRVFIAGAGGVARAIAFSMAQAGASHLTIHNRSADKADALLGAVHEAFPNVLTRRGDDRPANCDIAINGTSLGLGADDPLPFRLEALPGTATVAEVVMQPLMTPLLRAAAARGLRIVRGDAMLRFQLSAWVQFLGLAPGQSNRWPS